MGFLYIIAALSACGLFMLGLQAYSVRAFLRDSRKSKGRTDSAPPVSILKPLKGLDDNLYDNLASFCRLDYPKYEIIFTVKDPDDPAHGVAVKVKEAHPRCDITILTGHGEAGLNPKVNNLIPAYAASKYDFVLISDSNVLARPDYLRETASLMDDPEVGLVSNMIRGVGAESMGALFENLHLNTFIIGGVSFLERIVHMPCPVGKSMLMRKSALESFGGLYAVKDYLAEDYMMGRLMKRAGYRVRLSTHLINTLNVHWKVSQFTSRHTRWAKLRWRINKPGYLLELFINPILLPLVGLIARPGMDTLGLLAAAWGIKISMDVYVGRIIDSGIPPAGYLLSPVKDLLLVSLWIKPILSGRIEWRGEPYIIGKDSLLVPCVGG